MQYDILSILICNALRSSYALFMDPWSTCCITRKWNMSRRLDDEVQPLTIGTSSNLSGNSFSKMLVSTVSHLEHLGYS